MVFIHLQENSAKAIARFDLDKTWREFLIALVIPSVFFIISFVTLIMITRSVKVGEDTVLRCELFENARVRHRNKVTITKEVIKEFDNEEEYEFEEMGGENQKNNVRKSQGNNGGAMVL